MLRAPARRRALVLAATAVVLAACASGPAELSAEDEAAIAAADLAFVGTDSLDFEPAEATAQAGRIAIALTCEQGVHHNLVVADEVVVACGRGETATGTVELDPGTYPFVCTVPGHSQRMRGELTVE